MKYRNTFFCILIVISIVIIFALNRYSTRIYSYGTYVFGTEVQLIIINRSSADANAASRAVFALFDEMHKELHTWQPSEVMRLNKAIAKGEAFQASLRLANMLREARTLSIESEGIFDPGISSLVALWGFQADTFRGNTPPSDEAITALLQNPPSIKYLTISNDNLVKSSNSLVKIDFGGYAKGWALDEAMSLLKSHGINNAMIDIGGDIIVLGNKNGSPWKVGIRYPRQSGLLASLELHDGEAIATSGDYYRYFDSGGIRYSHIIDPRTGKPSKKSQSSTILISPSDHAGALSDAMSKIPFILGPDETPHFIKKMNISNVLLIDNKGEIWVTPEMNKRLNFYDPNLRINFIPAVSLQQIDLLFPKLPINR